MTGIFVGYNIKTGEGLSFISSTNTLENTGVLSLQGDTGSLSLASGTGISISGLTITNTGLISANAGSGISVSGSNPLTITNTGVLSLQGDTGTLSLGAGSGIGISGLTISNTGVLGVGGGTTNYLSGSIKLVAGSDIDITQSGQDITIANTYSYSLPNTVLTSSSTYVKTLQGDSGELSLTAGTGIGISGLTISNTGVTSLAGSTTISVSGSVGGITVKGLYEAGSGLSLSGATFTNTGVLGVGGGTTSYLTGDVKFVAGSNIDITQSGQDITIANTYSYTLPSTVLTSSSTYVKTLQGSSGALSLSAGTGISISGLTITNTEPNVDYPAQSNTWSVLQTFGDNISFMGEQVSGSTISAGSFLYDNGTNFVRQSLAGGTGISVSDYTITNTGVTSLASGTGISLSGSTGGVTVTNTGVTSLQGDTGGLSLSAGSGISISGLTITNSGVLGIGGSTTSYLSGDIKFVAGSNIGISQSGQDITISNTYSLPSTVLTSSSTYVKTLQGSSGALSLSSGTGISISGLTISNSGVTSLTAGTGISLSGSTGDVTITNTGSAYTAGNGISISSGTIAMSGSMSGGVGMMVFSGDANNPSIAVYDTANTTYKIEIGQASASGDYFTNAVTGDSIVKGTYERLLLGVGSNNSALVLTSGYAVETKNNTLDNGSGDMTIAGSLSASGTLLTTGSLGLDLGDSVGVRALVYDTSGTAGYQTGYGVNVVGVNSLDFFIGYGNGSNTSFNIGSGGNSTYPYTSYKRLFTVANTGEITTVKNTLDDGSGNMTVAGTLEGTFAGVLSAGTVGISDGGDSVVDSPYGMGILGYNQFFSNNTGYTIYLFLYGSSAVGSSGASGVTEIGSIDNGAVYSIPYSSNNTGVLTANNGGSCIAIWFAV